VTKGDLVDQRRKLVASGLAGRFDHVEIVPDKDVAAYEELLRFLECPAERFLMVGNSEVSDVAPVLAAGGWAVHVPHTTTWSLERASPTDHPRRAQVRSLGQVPALLQGSFES
jgi:putative hydrolase of the HAD superfamily